MSVLRFAWVPDGESLRSPRAVSMNRSFRLGSVRGVDVVADFSLFLIAGLLTWSLYVDLAKAFPTSSSDGLLLAASFGGLLFFGSVFLHELSHSVVALHRGLSVRRIRLFIFGGVSEIEEEAASPSDELAVTLAGPAASLVLGITFLLMAWPLAAGLALPGRIALILGVANLSIALFNLLPGLPLDGGRMLRALLWRRGGDRERATRLAATTGRGLGALLMVAGAGLAIGLGDLSAIWFVAVGWFLYQSATTSVVQEEFAARIHGLTVADVMRRTEMAIDGDMSVADALALHGWGDRLRPLPVSIGGRVIGVFGTDEVVAVAEHDRGRVLVRDAMRTIGPGDVIAADTGLREALIRDAGGAGLLVVVQDGAVIGLVTGEEMEAIFGDLSRDRRRHQGGQ